MKRPDRYAPESYRVVRATLADGTVKEYRYKRASGGAPPKSESIGELIRAYQSSPEYTRLAQSTQGWQRRGLKQLGALSKLDIKAIKRRQLLTLRDDVNIGHGPGAASLFVSTCRAFFAWCRDRDWIDLSPAHELRGLPHGNLPAWTQAQADLALRIFPEHLRRAVLLALYTGQRRGDLVAMRWAAYDGTAIRLTQQKTGTALVIPVHQELRQHLDTWKGHPAGYVLTRANGKPWKPTTLSQAFHQTLARLGMPDKLNIHGLRKLAAARLAEAGCSASEIAAITGHRTLAMVSFYTRSADQERMAGAAMGKLEAKRQMKTSAPKKVLSD